MTALSIARCAALYGDAPALVFDHETLTWGDVAERAREPLWALSRRADVFDRVVARDESSIVSIYAAIEAKRPLLLLSSRESSETHALARRIVRLDSAGPTPLAYVLTSGSAAAPRVAKLSRAAFVASADASAKRLPFGVGDRWLVAMPLSHVGGLSILVRALFGGGAVVVAPEGQWDANEAVARIARAEVTHASFVPTMLARVVAERRAAPASLRAVLVGGAASPPGLLEDARGLGWPVLPTYGLTEASSQVATRPLGDVDDGAGRIGPPLEGFEVRIVEGEIQIRGPALFSGYVGAEDAFTEDGWFATNDLGRFLTDGSLVVAGRRDDVIITGGENVHPDEIEGILTEHEDVREACVFGLPDAEWGEVVAAALVTTSDAAALAPWLASRFVAHRRPRRIFVVDSLLKRPSGKVDRRGTKRLVMG